MDEMTPEEREIRKFVARQGHYPDYAREAILNLLDIIDREHKAVQAEREKCLDDIKARRIHQPECIWDTALDAAMAAIRERGEADSKKKKTMSAQEAGRAWLHGTRHSDLDMP